MMIDVLIPSSSRFECLVKTYESFLKNVKYSGEFRFCLHEDVFDPEDSKKVMDFVTKNNFCKVKKDDNKIGFGPSVSWLFEQIQSEFFFYLEDDWEWIREVDLDSIIKLFKNNPKINQIGFNKRKTMPSKQWFNKKTITVDGINLTTSMHWSFIPAIWRYSFINKYLERYYDGNPAWGLNTSMKGTGERAMWNADKIIDKLGCFFLGSINEPPYVNHLGDDISRRKQIGS